MSGTLLAYFEVPGPAVGAARPRVVRLKNGASHAFMPDKAVAWEQACAARAKESYRKLLHTAPVSEAVEVAVWVHTSRPKRLRRKRDPRGPMPGATGKPDLDNVLKLVMDALKKGGVISDDTMVCAAMVSRWHLAIDEGGYDTEPERVVVRVERPVYPAHWTYRPIPDDEAEMPPEEQ